MHTLQAVGVRARACASAAQGISAGDGMTDASLVPIRRIQVIAVGSQLARSQPRVPFEAGLGNKAGEMWRWVSSITPGRMIIESSDRLSDRRGRVTNSPC